MWRLIIVIYIAAIFCSGCASTDMETVIKNADDHHAVVDSIAIGNTPFGIDRSAFIASLDKAPVENRMTEPQFNELVTELEVPVRIGSLNYSGHYYFDRMDRLYKVHLQYQNEKRLLKGDYNEAYENLYEHFKTKYGPRKSVNAMPGLKSVTWNFKNKKIELTGSCLASNCSMECNIIDTDLFAKSTIQKRVSGARLHLELKLHPENF